MKPTQKQCEIMIEFARKYVKQAAYQSSAELCLEDAERLSNMGDYSFAFSRAQRSLEYSLGIYEAVGIAERTINTIGE